MPVFVVHSSGDQGPHLAAAVMAVTLARASGPFRAREQRGRTKFEKTRPRNPNRLTVNQHVFPSKSIERFTGQGRRVAVYDLHRNVVFRARPANPVFLTFRAWDQRAEAGYMKHIEDEFQTIVAPIADGKTQTIAPEAKPFIDRMYALWHTRSRQREIESQEVQLNVAPGSDYTKEQEENLEKNGYMFVRKGGGIPGRQLNGIELEMRADDLARHLAGSVPRWGVISTQSGEFIVPDVPSHGIIPVTPRLALVQSAPDGMITERNLAEINLAMRTLSQDYFFARDLSTCPF
ncbi:MAG: hypothetical protein ACRCTX_13435 [Afipia sp.]